MLSRLYVKNIALISEADITFDNGLNVLSGETGSGKSVILDSINFILGSKADRTMIRYGETEAFVKAEFEVPASSEVIKKLEEYDIESDGTIIISRRINSDGRGSIKINGSTVTVSMLKNVTQHLVDVHGQSEHFFLLNENNQLKVIDGLLGNKADEIKHCLSKLISRNKQIKDEISALGGNEEERARKLDLLEYQINEIEKAELKEGEFEELKARQNIIQNTEIIMSALNSVKCILSDDGGCSDLLSSAVHEINKVSNIDDRYSALSSRLEELSFEVSDIADTASDLTDNLSFDESEALNIDERIELIKSLQKKYGKTESEILSFKDKAKTEYDAISDSAVLIDRYLKEITKNENEMFGLCRKLTEMRKNVSVGFSESVEQQLKTLNIPYARFNVVFSEYDSSDFNCTANGCDTLSFEFSANKGEPLKPLNKVISGGEMSRFMLAVKTQLKDLNGISTYIFDEIDAGISGFTAGTVASKFLDIAETTQIIAVSHLPQVCAASDAQFLIYKVEEDGKTLTKVSKLTENQKIEEIVRLTGSTGSEVSVSHAKELIKQFKN